MQSAVGVLCLLYCPGVVILHKRKLGTAKAQEEDIQVKPSTNEIGPLAPFSLEEFCIIADIIASCPPSAARRIYREFERPPSFASLVSMCSLSAENIWVVAHRLKRHLGRTRG